MDSADLVIAAHAFNAGELTDDQVLIALNRYAQLPIVNSKRRDLKALQQKGFTKQDLKNIYFNTDNNSPEIFDVTGVIKKFAHQDHLQKM